MWIVGTAVVIILLVIWWENNKANLPSVANPLTGGGTEASGTGGVSVQDSSSATVASILAGIPNAGRFNQLLSSTGVASAITGKGPYTVFVATDAAFGRLVPGTINTMSAAEQKRTLQYHIVSGKKLDVDAVQSGQVQALSGDSLNFTVDAAEGGVYVNSGYVLKVYKAKNGIIYVINSVLIPPKRD
jgi:uncharacterized surface protein with fasciclin (FAS1) repeats